MKNEVLAQLFYQELEKIHYQNELDLHQKVESLYQLFSALLVEITKDQQLQFFTLFSRVAYACHRFQVDSKIRFYLHKFRKRAKELMQKNRGGKAGQEDVQLGERVMVEAIRVFLEQEPPENIKQNFPSDWPFPNFEPDRKAFYPSLQVILLSDYPDDNFFVAVEDDPAAEEMRIQYNIVDRSDQFAPTVTLIRQVIGFPCTVQLIDVELTRDGVYRPAAIVVEPDYLVDVSAISECFKDFGAEARLHLLRKFLPFQTSKYLLIGNIANFFLDELLHDPEQTFRDLFPKVFHLNPLAFCLLEDHLIKEIRQKVQLHFVNLKRVILQDFEEQKIETQHSFIEPSFYAPKYGIQGRLDLFYRQPDRMAIVELKSGKPFRPNVYGLSVNHFTQTLLYDLLIKSVFQSSSNITNYILYSGIEEKQLRFAPAIKAQQMEALQLRNQIIGLEWGLANLGYLQKSNLLQQGDRFFSQLRTSSMPQAKGFIHRDLSHFEQVYFSLAPLERRYFTAFAGFIAREHRLGKIGSEALSQWGGQAGLWRSTQGEKEQHFEIFSHLALIQETSTEEEPILIFQKTERTNELANFRVGDITVLFPDTDQQIWNNQIFKCSIVAITPGEVIVRLRSRQLQASIFKQFAFWNLEHDVLDNNFIAMYKSLLEFAAAPKNKRNLLLTIDAPPVPPTLDIPTYASLTVEQQQILQKALSAQGYFLLWGPPGTGKTSLMLRCMVDYLLHHTQEQILLLAYTNRAVDEICESIDQIGEWIRESYFRISSRYTTSASYQQQLLGHKMSAATSRKALKQFIGAHRIVVATVASLANKPELLALKQFDTVIIDEASQILEPALVGMLTRFKRFILVGDHKQLPAVVRQDAGSSGIQDEALSETGLNNLRNSLFERLFKRAKANNWDWAYAQLTHQGRMHQAIMDFPSRYFYDASLKILPDQLPAHKKQLIPLNLKAENPVDALESALTKKRLLFIPTSCDFGNPTQKTNRFESEVIAELITKFLRLYEFNGIPFTKRTLGIITPYRAQIAQIKLAIAAKGLETDLFTVDTVERYQGGARDIILISLCTNSIRQFDSLISLSEEGVDRKLNVALTRARKQLVIVGNEALLAENPVYRQLINHLRIVEEV